MNLKKRIERRNAVVGGEEEEVRRGFLICLRFRSSQTALSNWHHYLLRHQG